MAINNSQRQAATTGANGPKFRRTLFDDLHRGDLEVRLDLHFVGFAILLVVLMLELKDKLLAREELEVGRSVQSALMPDKNPNIPGWEIWMYTRPAKEVGGDMVDYLKFSEERLAVAVGDVAGKGLGAALLLVYSDGLTEARNEKGEFFGDQRLLELLLDMKGSSAEAAGARLVAAVDRFVGEARPNDDLSLILLKRLG